MNRVNATRRITQTGEEHFMTPHLLLTSFCVGALAIFSFTLYAQERTGAQSKAPVFDVATQQQLARQFADFQDKLVRLKIALSRGTPDQKKRAEVLDKVLDECKDLA